MAYTVTNFRTKKDFIAALDEAIAEGKPGLRAYQPGGVASLAEGQNTIEGPHYPHPHRWYANVTIKDGHVIKALK